MNQTKENRQKALAKSIIKSWPRVLGQPVIARPSSNGHRFWSFKACSPSSLIGDGVNVAFHIGFITWSDVCPLVGKVSDEDPSERTALS